MQPTNRLYYDHAYLTAFDARVVAVRPDGWAALDCSAFYPTSGGQPYDTGTLQWGDVTAHVTDVEVQDGIVWHKLDALPPQDMPVHGCIDWPRRLDHMQQHAGDHMIAGAAWQLYGAVTIGLHLGQTESTIDMDLPGGRTRLTAEEIDTLEAMVNARVQQDDSIRCWFPAPDELAALPLRKRPTVSEHVRVVAMGDYEMVACGGTHPATTGQIGPVKILSTAPARGKLRLTFVAGMRAVRYFQRVARCAEGLSAALSATPDTALDALRHERETDQEARRAAREQLTLAMLETLRRDAISLPCGMLYCGHIAYGEPETLLHAAAALTAQPGAIALLSCPRKDARMLIFARSADGALDMAQLLRESGARGGGKPDMAQGSAPDGAALESAKRILFNK